MYATAHAHIRVQSTGIVYSRYEKIVYDTIIRDAEIKLAYSALHEHLRQEIAAKDGMIMSLWRFWFHFSVLQCPHRCDPGAQSSRILPVDVVVTTIIWEPFDASWVKEFNTLLAHLLHFLWRKYFDAPHAVHKLPGEGIIMKKMSEKHTWDVKPN